jgi:hypothetical protein
MVGIDLMQFKGKYIVLYMGDSTDKDYEKGLEKYGKMCNSRPLNTDDRVKMFAVRCNPENVSGTVETVSPEANGMPVPTLSLNENNLLEQLKVNELPTVLMISPEWKIIFRGSSLGAAYKCLVSLTYGV